MDCALPVAGRSRGAGTLARRARPDPSHAPDQAGRRDRRLGDLRGLALDPSVIDPSEPEILEDLIKAAHADARRKADETQARLLSEAARGMGLPPGIDLPFGIKPGPF